MKGSTKVMIEKVMMALKNRDEQYSKGEELFKKAIKDFADLKRSTAWLAKWRFKNMTDKEVARRYLGAFSSWDEILYEVTTEEELSLIADYVWGSHSSEYSALKRLAQVSDSGFIEVSPTYAHFISKYTIKGSEV